MTGKNRHFRDLSQQVLSGVVGDKLTVLINDISLAMRRLEYAFYRGTVYKKCEGATYTYSYKCDVKAFGNSLAANESFKARLLRDKKKVIDILDARKPLRRGKRYVWSSDC